MRTQTKKQTAKMDQTIDSDEFNEESSSYSNILGKRSSSDNSVDQLRAETEDSGEVGAHDNGDKRERRLQQNRKSAKKCRLKKKAEYSSMKTDVNKLQEENKSLKDKINEMTIMLYQKIEDNSGLQRKLEQAQLQQVMFLSQMMHQTNQQSPLQQTLIGSQGSNASQSALQSLLQTNLGQNMGMNTMPGMNANQSQAQNQMLQMLAAQSNHSQQHSVQADSSRSAPSSCAKQFLLPSSGTSVLNGGNQNILRGGLSPNFSYKMSNNGMHHEMPNGDLFEQLKQFSQIKMADDSLKSLINLAGQNSERKISQ